MHWLMRAALAVLLLAGTAARAQPAAPLIPELADALARTEPPRPASVAASQPPATRVELAVERAPRGVTWMALARPDRLVIDLAGARAEPVRQASTGLIRHIKVERRGRDGVRVTLDLAGPARITSLQAGRSLVIGIAGTTASDFAGLVDAGAMTPPGSVAAVRTAEPSDRPLIILDPGHGGQDSGAISALEGRFEKDLTLSIARAIAAELEASGRFRVAFTRTDDRFVTLAERVAIARRARADLFLSIHGDSAPNPLAAGATVYTLSDVASDAMAARVAARENKADALATVPLGDVAPEAADILYDIARRGTMNASASFAQQLSRAIAARAPVTSNSHRFAGFQVLKVADMPAALLETGYLTNIDDARRLFSPDGQRAIAQAVRAALEAQFPQQQRLAATR